MEKESLDSEQRGENNLSIETQNDIVLIWTLFYTIWGLLESRDLLRILINPEGFSASDLARLSGSFLFSYGVIWFLSISYAVVKEVKRKLL